MRQARGARGIIHVHTEFSFDGVLQLPVLAENCRRRGLSFAAVTDHAESMTPELLDRLVAECRAASNSDFVMIPGLEHRFKRDVHVLALGQSKWVPASSPGDTLKALAGEGCVLVAAHCTSPMDLPAELLRIMTAVEIWNVTRHTRLLPTTRQFLVYRTLAESYPQLYAIGGLDMHKGIEWGCEVALDSACEPTPEAVLARLAAGSFSTTSRFLSFGSRPEHGARNVAFAAGDALAGVRNLRDRVLTFPAR